MMFCVPDISVILDHFDNKIIQKSYIPYKGFNFGYLFITSVTLICLAHVVNFIYWIMRYSADPEVQTYQIGLFDSELYSGAPEHEEPNAMDEVTPLQSPPFRARLLAHPPLLQDHRAHD